MSLEDKSILHPLPKSVKVRSTCNACQQAKIRCSHEKPSCRRCQKQNIECVYSMSRRLGRPAKKRDPGDEKSLKECLERRRKEKRGGGGRRRGREDTLDRTHEDAHVDVKRGVEEVDVGDVDVDVDDTPVEESLHTPIVSDSVDAAGAFSVADSMDFTPDTWLQELVSTQMPEDCTFLDTFDCSLPKDPASSLFTGTSVSDGCEQTVSTSSSSYFALDNPNTSSFNPQPALAMDLDYSYGNNTTSSNNTNLYEYQDWKKNALFLPMTDPLTDTLLQPALPLFNDGNCFDYDFLPSLDESVSLDFTPPPSAPVSMEPQPTIPTCQCYELAIRELIQTNLCASSRNGPCTIDTILTCQKGLQSLAHTILQCGACSSSKTRANLLMVVIVSIDSLVTMLETTILVRGSRGLGIFDIDMNMDNNINIHDGCMGVGINNSRNQVQRDPGTTTPSGTCGGTCNGNTHGFKSQIDACPLLVGNFRVPLDEKNSFIKQVLHARLSSLLGTIRRIRYCVQQMLGASAGRGRLVMIMETDRRVQVVMMRIKMLS